MKRTTWNFVLRTPIQSYVNYNRRTHFLVTTQTVIQSDESIVWEPTVSTYGSYIVHRHHTNKHPWKSHRKITFEKYIVSKWQKPEMSMSSYAIDICSFCLWFIRTHAVVYVIADSADDAIQYKFHKLVLLKALKVIPLFVTNNHR